MRPTQQIYSNYTAEDFKVWKILFDRQMKSLKPTVCTEYLDALKIIDFNADRIPDFSIVNKHLNDLTGWQIKVVPNISPQHEFFNYLSQKKFTATCWLRTMEQLDYIEEPDMFHDVFAHIPLLTNDNYCNFFKGISDIAMEHINDRNIIEMLGRLYWFTIEFGLIRNNGDLKIYGAGIISSAGETKHCLSSATRKTDFSIDEIFNTPFRTDIMQEQYFVIESFEQLYHSLPEIRRKINQMHEFSEFGWS